LGSGLVLIDVTAICTDMVLLVDIGLVALQQVEIICALRSEKGIIPMKNVIPGFRKRYHQALR
jgi:hypothetical protein